MTNAASIGNELIPNGCFTESLIAESLTPSTFPIPLTPFTSSTLPPYRLETHDLATFPRPTVFPTP